MDFARVPPALCPHCESTGTTGEACQQPVCVRWGYHCIPHVYVEGRRARHQIVGKLIDREFLVVDSIGEGGMGEVHLALQQPLLRKVAIKLVKGGQSNRAIEKFRGEAQAMGQLRHPNIVSLIKYGDYDGRPYFAMEFVENGRTLKDILNERLAAGRPLGTDEANHIISQMFDGLEAAHRLNLIHRDIKLENVLLESVPGNPRLVRILDFGLAKDIGDSDQTSIVSGTPIYMAPEQFLGTQLGPWTDVYALGVMSFVMVCGRNPLPVKSNTEIKAAKSSPAYEAILEKELAYLSPPMSGFFRRALSRDVAGRFKSMPEMREGWLRASQGLQPLPVSSTPALPEFDNASFVLLAPKTAILGHPTSNPWQGTVLLDSGSPDTGTPSAAQPVATPSPEPRRRSFLIPAGVGAAAIVGLVAWAIAGGSSTSHTSEVVATANSQPAAKAAPDVVEAVEPVVPGVLPVARVGVEAGEVDATDAAKATAPPVEARVAVEPDSGSVDILPVAPEPATLRIETVPAGAIASIGDTNCTTPCELSAASGNTVTVKLKGYVDREITVSEPALAAGGGMLKIELVPDETVRAVQPKPKPKPRVKPKPKIDYDAF